MTNLRSALMAATSAIVIASGLSLVTPDEAFAAQAPEAFDDITTFVAVQNRDEGRGARGGRRGDDRARGGNRGGNRGEGRGSRGGNRGGNDDGARRGGRGGNRGGDNNRPRQPHIQIPDEGRGMTRVDGLDGNRGGARGGGRGGNDGNRGARGGNRGGNDGYRGGNRGRDNGYRGNRGRNDGYRGNRGGNSRFNNGNGRNRVIRNHGRNRYSAPRRYRAWSNRYYRPARNAWRYHAYYYDRGYNRHNYRYYDRACHRNGDSVVAGALLGALFGAAVYDDDAAGALFGGFLGASVGYGLNDCDRGQYRYAVNYAFTNNTPYYWHNPHSGVRGVVYARDYYTYGNRRCRLGDAEIYMPDGSLEYDQVRMCQDRYGRWQVANYQ